MWSGLLDLVLDFGVGIAVGRIVRAADQTITNHPPSEVDAIDCFHATRQMSTSSDEAVDLAQRWPKRKIERQMLIRQLSVRRRNNAASIIDV